MFSSPGCYLSLSLLYFRSMNQLQKVWEKSFTDKRYRIGLHVVFWFVYLFMMLLINFFISITFDSKWDFHTMDVLTTLATEALLVGVSYYLIIFFPYRNLVIKKRYILGLLGIIVCIIFYIHLFYFIQIISIDVAEKTGHSLPPYAKSLAVFFDKGYFYFFSYPYLIIQIAIYGLFYMFLPVCFKFLRDQMRMQKKQYELQKKNIQLEMDFLKAQIHPHFLFNTLNNIYSLITHNENKKSAEMVSRLSSLLRYALYDGKTEFISLEKEIGMVKDFIGLEEVRTDDMHLDVKMPDNIPTAKLPPFLLLPLIENAFKHGANSQLSHPCVKIEIDIKTHQLWLQVKNSFDKEYRSKNSGGLGLLNLKKRLDYYYPDNYMLETDEQNKIFFATLKFPLSCPPLNA